MKIIPIALALLAACPAFAQESRLASDWRREREHIAENCDELAAKALASCAVTLITDYPFHIALGNLAPQNGFAFGLAFAERYTPNEDWRISFNADAVTSTSKSWRTGAYATFVRSKVSLPTVSTGPVTSSSANAIRDYPVFRLYAQRTVLHQLVDFGLDFDNPRPRVFGQDQTIVGGSAVVPLNERGLRAMGASIIGGVNGRFVTVHQAREDDRFLEVFEELRVKPSILGDLLRLNYSARLQQFLGENDASFHRWTVDLRHEFPLYQTAASTGPNDFNGPDECFASPTSSTCPPLTFSRNRSGSIGARLLAVSSSPFDEGGSVPFYFQPTLGGSDINNQRLLASFDDYRFRAPHLIAAQVSVEHSVWGPVGVYLMAEAGKAAQQRNERNVSGLLASYSAGASIRAAGAPVLTASWGWGSAGNRLIVTMDSSLLGGSARPPLH
jgi:hypothetical protein